MDFRCFESLDISVPAEGAILIGDNAQGKTSIASAAPASASLPTHGARNAKSATRATD
jgi:recombinational DNA repair ATPase RecF